MKDELYKKVFIRSEADLPKEEGIYFVGIKTALYEPEDVGGVGSIESYHFNCDEDNWLKEIDWYLQPIEPLPAPVTDAQQSTKEITDEEIENTSIAYDEPFRSGFEYGAKWLRDKQKPSEEVK